MDIKLIQDDVTIFQGDMSSLLKNIVEVENACNSGIVIIVSNGNLVKIVKKDDMGDWSHMGSEFSERTLEGLLDSLKTELRKAQVRSTTKRLLTSIDSQLTAYEISYPFVKSPERRAFITEMYYALVQVKALASKSTQEYVEGVLTIIDAAQDENTKAALQQDLLVLG